MIISELTTELVTDPAGIGYAPYIIAGNHMALETILNDKTGIGSGTINRTYADAPTLQSAVVVSEYLALTDIARQAWLLLVTASQNTGQEGSLGVPLQNSEIQAQVTAIWDAGTVTRSNLLALLTKGGSRAEVLWGDGAVVTINDISLAIFNARPATPSNLEATAISEERIDLTWVDASDDEDEFTIEWSLNGSNWIEAVTLPANTTSWSNTGLHTEVTYLYRIKASNIYGKSDYSNVAQATTLPIPVSSPPVGSP